MTMKNAQITDSQSSEPVTGVVLQRLVRPILFSPACASADRFRESAEILQKQFERAANFVRFLKNTDNRVTRSAHRMEPLAKRLREIDHA
jgi:UDP-N-acetylmuramoylalanine-D-glutamate ligase